MTVDDPAWVIVGYPRFAPQILDMVTLNEVVEDLAIRQFAFRPEMYGIPPFDPSTPSPKTDEAWRVWREQARWNPDYYPHFYRDIWPILSRPQQFSWVMDFDPFTGGDPHNDTPGQHGNLDPDLLGIPPYHGQDPAEEQRFRALRKFVFEVLRRPGEENQLTRPLSPGQIGSAHNPEYHRQTSTHSAALTGDLQNRLVAMPYLCGDNPLSNLVVSKFLRLTDTMLFLLGQWALGNFINEKREDIPIQSAGAGAKTGRQLDLGVLSNALGSPSAGWRGELDHPQPGDLRAALPHQGQHILHTWQPEYARRHRCGIGRLHRRDGTWRPDPVQRCALAIRLQRV